ncbi:hypothetical protein MKI84_17860 [Ancylobacter sp. A5.8]|uniref:hypothetical protein n=1 Tax=Ancylobacter gelatini TaxID=2919920 RepID=UPI001F4D9D19|nr:hypothetical protein [Ancylobacter gelatini]MCJ8144790.1 hypothetical protein [Ancylobacter gelatini]
MAIETIYIVQSFKAGMRGALRADQPTRARTGEMAIRTAERLAANKAGVVAFAMTGDAESGDYDEEPVILFRAGRLPAQFGDGD